MFYRIGSPNNGLELDVARGCLVREGVELHLTPRTFAVAAYLVRNAGRLVSKNELIENCWPESQGSDDVLAHAIANVRQALSDDSKEPTFVLTVPRRGYRFIAEVIPVEPSPMEAAPDKVTEPVADAPTMNRSRPAWIKPALAAAAVFAAAIIGLFARTGPKPESNQSVPSQAMTANLAAARAYTNGIEAARQYRPAEAIAQFEEAARLDPGFVMASARIGYVYSVRWLWEEKGRQHLEAAFAQRGKLDELSSLYILVWYDLAHRDYPGAVAALRQLLARYPRETEAREELARILLGEAQYAEAQKELEESIRRDAAAPQSHNILSAVFAATHNFPGAVLEAKEFVRLQPNEVNAHDTLGLAYEAANQFEEAEKEYRWILARQPKFASRIHLANTLFKMGRWREAKLEIESYIANAASSAERQWGYDQLAVIALHEGNDRGVLHYAGFQPLEGYHDQEVLLALRRKDLANADRLLNQRPPHADRGQRANSRLELYVRAERALATGDSAALALFQEGAAQRTPLYAIDWYEDCLARAYLRLGRTKEAVAEFERVLRIYPRLALAWNGLAQAYLAQGDERQARIALAKVSEIWRHADPDVAQLLAFAGRRYEVPGLRVSLENRGE